MSFSQKPYPTETNIPSSKLYTQKSVLSDLEGKELPFFKQLEEKGLYLSETQLEMVRRKSGQNFLISGAGNGKTTVIVCRIGYMIQQHNILPNQILCLTFNDHMAQKLKKKSRELTTLSEEEIKGVRFQTFHSYCFGVLRKANIKREIIKNKTRKHIVIKNILKEMGIKDSAYQPAKILSTLSDLKLNFRNIGDYPEKNPIQKEVKEIMTRFEKWKRENKYMDYDDVIVNSYYILQKNKSLLSKLRSEAQYILIDEAQDMTVAQYNIVKRLAHPLNNLFVVGDPEQSIYSFAGGSKDILLSFENDYPEAEVYTLNVNFRSTQSIVGLANSFSKHHQEYNRYKRKLKSVRDNGLHPRYLRPVSTEDEASKILNYIENQVKIKQRKYSDFTILYRTKPSARAFLEICCFKGIPYQSFSYDNALSFYKHPVTRPIMGFLRLSVEPKNIDGIKDILSSVYVNKNKAFSFIKEQQKQNEIEFPLEHLMSYDGIQTWQKKELEKKIAIIREIADKTPKVAIQYVRESFYDQFIEISEREYLSYHHEEILEYIEELEASASRFECIVDFMTCLASLQEKVKDYKKGHEENSISVMTIHKSKGEEFDCVCVIGFSEYMIPHISALSASRDREWLDTKNNKNEDLYYIEEERRLSYVAITRAKEELIISSPQFFRTNFVPISRFITEIFTPTETVELEEVVELEEDEPIEEDNTFIFEELMNMNGAFSEAPTMHPFFLHPARSMFFNLWKPQMETIASWNCSNKDCKAWYKVDPFEKSAKKQYCSICGSEMLRGERFAKIDR